MMQYVLRPTQNDIIHYGKGHDDSPPGRGSGRYAWGSGKEPGNKKVSKKEKISKAGEYIHDMQTKELDEQELNEYKWDDIMQGILKAKFDSKDEQYHLNRAIEASIKESEDIGRKYNTAIKTYLIDTGLANEKMSSKKIGKMINNLEKKYMKETKKRLDEAEKRR